MLCGRPEDATHEAAHSRPAALRALVEAHVGVPSGPRPEARPARHVRRQLVVKEWVGPCAGPQLATMLQLLQVTQNAVVCKHM
eukprot:scaffold71007_cov71-Phaeocystis_antarctica.AAC.4